MDHQKALIEEYERETASTRKTLEAIPEDADFAWKPHAKSFSLGRLAGHTSELAGNWGISTLTTDGIIVPAGHKFEPYIVASKAEMLERFDRETATVKTELASFAPERWDETWKFQVGDATYVSGPKGEIFRTWVLNHMIHHRAQLGVYLRLLDQPIPGIYGPSADSR
jgi:uncharacterized damage-inducible protein DinB